MASGKYHQHSTLLKAFGWKIFSFEKGPNPEHPEKISLLRSLWTHHKFGTIEIDHSLHTFVHKEVNEIPFYIGKSNVHLEDHLVKYQSGSNDEPKPAPKPVLPLISSEYTKILNKHNFSASKEEASTYSAWVNYSADMSVTVYPNDYWKMTMDGGSIDGHGSLDLDETIKTHIGVETLKMLKKFQEKEKLSVDPPNGLAKKYKHVKYSYTYYWDAENYQYLSNNGKIISVKTMTWMVQNALITEDKNVPVSLQEAKDYFASDHAKWIVKLLNEKHYCFHHFTMAGHPVFELVGTNKAIKLNLSNQKFTVGEFDQVKKLTPEATYAIEHLSKFLMVDAYGFKGQANKHIVTAPIKPAENEFTNLTYAGVATSLGGAFIKHFFVDEKGDKWIFKPGTQLNGKECQLKAHADETASKIQERLRPDVHVPVRTVRMNLPNAPNTLGSIQKMIPNISAVPTFFCVPPTELKPFEIVQLQQEHVVDWLIANHDAHAHQFIRTIYGQVFGIDKTQAFKHMGHDQLSLDYHPNKMEHEPYYNILFLDIKNGKVSFDPQYSYGVIKKAQSISDDDYREMLQPYVDSRFTSEPQKAQFYKQAIARKHNLKLDFEAFYSAVLGMEFKFL